MQNDASTHTQTFIGRALQRQAATMGQHQGFGNGQAQATASGAVQAGQAAPEVAIKHLVQFFGRNADTLVCDGQLQAGRVLRHALPSHRHTPLGMGIADRIVQQSKNSWLRRWASPITQIESLAMSGHSMVMFFSPAKAPA